MNGRPGFECLCTDLGLWAPTVFREGGSVRVVTLDRDLPDNASTVDVVLPGLSAVRIPAPAALTGADTLGPPVSRDVGRWTYDRNPPLPWATQDWPTPLPDPAQLADYRSAVESIGRFREG